MSEAHTPGPWRHDESGAADWGEVYAGDVKVAACNMLVGPDAVRANANLIAAAPDLLMALKCFMDALSAPNSEVVMVASAWEAAQIAVYRAEGGFRPSRREVPRRGVMAFLYRQWLRLLLCEPEEWIEIKLNVDGWTGVDIESGYHTRRVRRYEIAFGPWRGDKY